MEGKVVKEGLSDGIIKCLQATDGISTHSCV